MKPESNPINLQKPNEDAASFNSKAAILEQAKHLFLSKGFDGTSINDLVQMAKVQKPTIYHYFGNKKGLFADVLIDLMREGHDFIIKNIKSSQSTHEKLFRLAEGYFQMAPPSLNTLLRDALHNLGPVQGKRFLEAHQFYTQSPLEAIFSEGFKRNEIRDFSPTELTLLFISLVDGYAARKALPIAPKTTAKASAKLVVDIFMDGLANPVEAASE